MFRLFNHILCLIVDIVFAVGVLMHLPIFGYESLDVKYTPLIISELSEV